MIIENIGHYEGQSIIEENATYSFVELAQQIASYQRDLKDKLVQGDVVIIDADYSFHSIALLFALSKLNLIIVPIIRSTAVEFEDKLRACGANKIISLSDSKLSFREIPEEITPYEGYSNITRLGHSGIVLFSSGTTGAPKVMVQDLTKLMENFAPPRRQKKLRFLVFLMFDHIGGLNTILGCMNNGSTAVIPKDRNPENIISIIEEKRVQVLPTSPTFLNLMLQVENFETRDLSSLRLVTYGTERMPEELLNRLNQRISGVKFLQTFGTSETGILKTVSKSSNSLFFKIVNDDVDYKIVNNQLLLKTKTSVQGYKNQQSDQFLSDGWFATGDLVEEDGEGNIKIVGRINDVINVGGQKVLPIEVEKAINAVEGVIDASVFGKANAITGQMVCANVVVNPNFDPSEVKRNIKKTCQERLDKFKRPVKISISKEIKFTTRFKKSLK